MNGTSVSLMKQGPLKQWKGITKIFANPKKKTESDYSPEHSSKNNLHHATSLFAAFNEYDMKAWTTVKASTQELALENTVTNQNLDELTNTELPGFDLIDRHRSLNPDSFSCPYVVEMETLLQSIVDIMPTCIVENPFLEDDGLIMPCEPEEQLEVYSEEESLLPPNNHFAAVAEEGQSSGRYDDFMAGMGGGTVTFENKGSRAKKVISLEELRPSDVIERQPTNEFTAKGEGADNSISESDASDSPGTPAAQTVSIPKTNIPLNIPEPMEIDDEDKAGMMFCESYLDDEFDCYEAPFMSERSLNLTGDLRKCCLLPDYLLSSPRYRPVGRWPIAGTLNSSEKLKLYRVKLALQQNPEEETSAMYSRLSKRMGWDHNKRDQLAGLLTDIVVNIPRPITGDDGELKDEHVYNEYVTQRYRRRYSDPACVPEKKELFWFIVTNLTYANPTISPNGRLIIPRGRAVPEWISDWEFHSRSAKTTLQAKNFKPTQRLFKPDQVAAEIEKITLNATEGPTVVDIESLKYKLRGEQELNFQKQLQGAIKKTGRLEQLLQEDREKTQRSSRDRFRRQKSVMVPDSVGAARKLFIEREKKNFR